MQIVSVAVLLEGEVEKLERLRTEGFGRVEGEAARFVKFVGGMVIQAFTRHKLLRLSFSIPTEDEFVRIADMVPFSLEHKWGEMGIEKLASVLGEKVLELEFQMLKDYTEYIKKAGWEDQMGMKVYTPTDKMGDFDMHYNRPIGCVHQSFVDSNVGDLGASYLNKLRKVGFPMQDQ
jgi:hypothetical protein